MPMLVNDSRLEEELIADRRERGIDKFDEVWDGMYVMAPIANNEHQAIQGGLTAILSILISLEKLGDVHPGANVSDQEVDWTHNYRVPDVLVFLNGNPAEDRESHWFGGPDLAVEIVSQWDRSREKIDFYSGVGVRELLIIDRKPWQMELFKAVDGKLKPVSIATEANANTIECQTVPITLKLVQGSKRPGIFVTARDGRSWTI
ncbi:MAG: Uma2 family endonuclease [Phycisphaerae bacterium]|nr:Uma2 family endonuclease [Phycisphaerae bacterium]